MHKELVDMTRTEKLAELKGKMKLDELEEKITKCNYKRSTARTQKILELYFVDGNNQVTISKDLSTSRQNVSNAIARFIIRLYEQ